jgi:hypothetical protein
VRKGCWREMRANFPSVMHTASAIEVRFAEFGAGYIVNKGSPSAMPGAARNQDFFSTCWRTV